jgi:predicted nucleic acid-binding protein
MIGLDCNILVQLAIADHPSNANTVAKVRSEVAAGEKFVFAPLVATEFLHVVTDERRISPPLTMADAIAWLQSFVLNSGVSLVFPSEASFNQTLEWMRKYNLGRKRILDTHLAAILHTNGVSRLLTSNGRDFAIFAELNIVSP